jgi:hypothetical protein
MSNVVDSSNDFGLRALDEQTVIAFLEGHPKYLHNPLTDSERGLIRDIIRVVCPLTRLRPRDVLSSIEGEAP